MLGSEDHVRQFLDGNGVANVVEHTLALDGGFSGAEVILAWVQGLPPIVVKTGPAESIAREHAGRVSSYSRENELKSLNLHGLGVEKAAGDGITNRSIAYLFEGGASYAEMQRRSNFGGYLEAFLSHKVPVESLEECFRQIVVRVGGATGRRPRSTPLPLSEYLPRVEWEQLANLTDVISSLLPRVTGFQHFERWFTSSVDRVRIAPIDDSRTLHGDLWFGNILVDSVKSDVYIIDFGKASTGHVFRDLARFEIDLILRCGSSSGSVSPDTRVASMRRAALASLPVLDEELESLIPVRLWRKSVLEGSTVFAAGAAFEMYRWFLLVELIRRLRWITASGQPTERDAGPILEAILVVQEAIDPSIPRSPSPRAPGLLQSELRLIDVYLPRSGTERGVNHSRNLSKGRALRSSANALGSVRLVAETAHSYLSQRGVFAYDVRDVLEKGGQIHVVTLDRQFGLDLIEAHPSDRHANTKDFIRKFDEATEGFEILREEYSDRIVLGRVSRSLAATILITSDSIFYEPYLPSSRSRRPRVLFDTFEFEIEASNEAHLASLLSDHVDYLTESARHE